MVGVTQVKVLVAFVDLSRFAAHTEDLDELEVSTTVDAYYELVDATVRAAGGRVVKFIGDAGLLVFPAEHVDAGVLALFDLKQRGCANQYPYRCGGRCEGAKPQKIREIARDLERRAIRYRQRQGPGT